MIKPEDLTKEQFLDQILEIMKENPDNLNPQNANGNCVYEDPNENHCLIGEWLSVYYPEILKQMPKESDGCRFRMESMDVGGTPAGLLLKKNNFLEEVYVVSGSIQRYADGGYCAEEGNSVPRKWSRVKDKVVNGEF